MLLTFAVRKVDVQAMEVSEESGGGGGGDDMREPKTKVNCYVS